MHKRILSFSVCILLIFLSILSVNAESYSKDEISSHIEKVISYKMELLSVNGNNEFISELSKNTDNADTQWFIISLSNYGYDVSLLSQPLQVSALKLYYDKAKATDFQRMSIALTACGINCKNVGGKNFLADSTYNNTSLSKQGINAYAYALLALNAAKIDESADYYIEEILNLQLVDGGFALAGTYSDVDVTAICIQALAAYRNDNNKVSESIEKAITCLSKKQNDDGSYSSYGTKNCESTAQVISALVSLEIDPQSDSRFIKNDVSTIDALLKYQNPDGGFAHILGYKSNSMATVQALKALVDYDEFLKNESMQINSSEEKDKSVVPTDAKSTENNSNDLQIHSVDEESTINEDEQSNFVSTTEKSVDSTQPVEKDLKSTEKISTSDEIYISDKSDMYTPIPTHETSNKAKIYSDESVFFIAIAGLSIIFIVLLVIKLVISKKNGEEFSLNFIGRNGEDDEED